MKNKMYNKIQYNTLFARMQNALKVPVILMKLNIWRSWCITVLCS